MKKTMFLVTFLMGSIVHGEPKLTCSNLFTDDDFIQILGKSRQEFKVVEEDSRPDGTIHCNYDGIRGSPSYIEWYVAPNKLASGTLFEKNKEGYTGIKVVSDLGRSAYMPLGVSGMTYLFVLDTSGTYMISINLYDIVGNNRNNIGKTINAHLQQLVKGN